MSHFLKSVLLALFAVSAAHAQIGRGNILGTVRDSSGAVIPGAQVEAVQRETNLAFRTQTTEAGVYFLSALPIGEYGLNVSARGFKRAVRDKIVLSVDDRLVVNVALEIGDLAESVQVTSEIPLVDLADATVGKVIENKRLTSLPLNGRNAVSMVVLTPSVRAHTINSNGFSETGATLSAFSINGSPPTWNSVTLDGSTNNGASDGYVSSNPSVDAVEEFKVLSGTMSAEYGFTAGGVVTMVTKSGTNTLHGSLYEFLRNDKFDARNTFAALKPPLRYNQFGGTLGGPVRKNRTFYFANFEGWRYNTAAPIIATVPTAAQRTGNLSGLLDASGKLIPIYDPATTRPNPNGSGFVRDLFAGNLIPAQRLDKAAASVLSLFPLPNRTPSDPFTNSNNFLINASGTRHTWQTTDKVDHRFSEKNGFFVRFVLWDFSNDNGTNGAPYTDPRARLSNDNNKSYNLNLTDTHTFTPSLINEFRFAVLREHNFTTPTAADWAQLLGLPASMVLQGTSPRLSVQGLPIFPAQAATVTKRNIWDTFQLIDNLAHVWGKHNLKFGADLRRNRYNRFTCNGCSGVYTFNSVLTGNAQQPAGTGAGLASLLLGEVASATFTANTPVSFAGWSEAVYIQDDWKISRRLTLNLGMRWDYQQVPLERYNRYANFNPFATNPQNGLLGRQEYAGVDYGRTAVQPDYRDFSPRFGFAYDIFGDGKTAIRGGYGIFYQLAFQDNGPEDSSGFNGTVTSYVPPGGNTQAAAFPFSGGLPFAPTRNLGAALGPSAFQSGNVVFIEPHAHWPYAQEWTVTLQRQLRAGWMMEAGYSGNKATHLFTAPYNLNQLDPKYFSLGTALQDRITNPYSGIVSGAFGGATITRQQLLLPYPYYGNVNVRSARQGSAIYHSWMWNAEKRMSNGFVLLASYTFGKLINGNIDSNAPSNTEQIKTGNNWRLPRTNRRLERGLDSTDSASRFVFSSVYELPFGKGKRWSPSGAWAERLAGGWQLNGVAQLQSGLPLIIRGANNSLADRPNSTGRSAKLDNPTRDQWFDAAQFINPPLYTIGNAPRTLPNVRGPGAAVLDLSVNKNTAIRERVNLQFRAEAFNFINRTNLLEPNGTFVPGPNGTNQSGAFGKITTARDARVIQFALKLLF